MGTNPGPAPDGPNGRSGNAAWSIDLVPTPCALLDERGAVTTANDAWRSAIGRDPLVVEVGASFVDVVQALTGSQRAADGVHEVLRGASSTFTYDIASAGAAAGRWFRLLAAGRDGGGASVVLVDIPRQDRAEEARLSGIIHSAMDAIITIDESQRVVMFNQAAERIFGVPAGEAVGSALDRFIPERFRRAHAGHVRAFADTGVSMRGMGRLGMLSGLRSDGSEFPIEASISQAVTDGQRFFTVILRDISERKKLEGQLLQSQKMEGLGRLAGGVAHDFNNLLMAILNYLTLAGRRIGPDHPAQDALAHAKEAADRAATLTRQLLTFARKQPVSPRVLCPRDIVTGLEPMLRRLIGEDVTMRTAPALDTGNVRADPTQLEQVLMNLVVNARDAMPRGGTLTIETGNVVLDEAYCGTRVGATPGEHVMLAVTDTGMGMAPETLSRLFEPFFTTKPPGQGTGLGLATCHGIVRQSGGHIAVYSEQGRGTAMKVFLPRVMADKAVADAAAPGASAMGGTETVLLVEDSEMVRNLIAASLRSAGYTVIVTSNGDEAVRAAQMHSGRIDLLVTDVVMPGMTGVQLAKTLQRVHGVTRVIFISGYTEESIVDHGVDASTAFLSKPFTTDVLLHKVRSVLGATAGG